MAAPAADSSRSPRAAGTNEFHGGARYFRRHDSLNADPYFNNARGGSGNGFPRPLYRYNFYGWDFGGPVVIPQVVNGRNKLFFFISQEYYRPTGAAGRVHEHPRAHRRPSAAATSPQSVDGSGRPITIIDPNTGAPFPGNIIPANRIYAPGKADAEFPARAEHHRRRQRLQLHVAGAQFLSAQREHHARRLADQFDTPG